MFKLIQKFRSHKLLTAISILTAFSFLSGEFFNCCFINQAFAAKIKKIVTVLNQTESNSKTDKNIDDEDHHSECHGHNDADGTELSSGQAGKSVAMNMEGHCLSEQSITQQSMVANLSYALNFTVEQTGLIVASILTPLKIVTQPRPQNKSSPPVYLLTLQILV